MLFVAFFLSLEAAASMFMLVKVKAKLSHLTCSQERILFFNNYFTLSVKNTVSSYL